MLRHRHLPPEEFSQAAARLSIRLRTLWLPESGRRRNRTIQYTDMEAIRQIDHILQVLNDHGVEYMLIGGVNYLLRHQPIATFDVDFWIEDSDENRGRCHTALVALGASWGPNDEQWRDVKDLSANWLERQGVFCLTSRYGWIDLFARSKGLVRGPILGSGPIRELPPKVRRLSACPMRTCYNVNWLFLRKSENWIGCESCRRPCNATRGNHVIA